MKKRVDILIVTRGLVKSRNVAKELIRSGKVLINGKIILKPGAKISIDTKIEIKEMPKYVSRGGLKIERALDILGVEVKGKIAADVGCSTGGFTDCLLQRGTKHIYAIDVGRDQFSPKLKKDSRVSLYEKTDIRNLKNLPEKVDLATIDVSFISLTLVLDSLQKLLKPKGKVIAFLKPQFEVGPDKDKRDRRGVVKDENLRELTIKKVKQWTEDNNYKVEKVIESPIKGKMGNIEYFLYLRLKRDDKQKSQEREVKKRTEETKEYVEEN